MNMILQYILRKHFTDWLNYITSWEWLMKQKNMHFYWVIIISLASGMTSYKILNKDYEKQEKVSKVEKDNILNKFKSLFK